MRLVLAAVMVLGIETRIEFIMNFLRSGFVLVNDTPEFSTSALTLDEDNSGDQDENN